MNDIRLIGHLITVISLLTRVDDKRVPDYYRSPPNPKRSLASSCSPGSLLHNAQPPLHSYNPIQSDHISTTLSEPP